MRSNLSKEEMIAWRNRNIQDTRYNGKWLSDYIMSNVSFNECDKYGKKVIIANKNLVTYLKKRLGRSSDYMISDVKYAENALVSATVSHDMINKIIEYSKTNNETNFPLPWPNFNHDISNMPSVFVSRAPRRKNTGPAHDETIRRMLIDKEGIIKSESRIDIKKLKLNSKGEIENYSEKSKRTDKPLYNALRNALIENGGDSKKAFINNFYKPKKDGKLGNIVRKVKIEGATKLPVKLKNTAIATNGTLIRIDIFKVEGEGYYFVPIYINDTTKPQLPLRAPSSGKKRYEDWQEMREEDFIFSVYPKDLLYIKTKTSITLHSTKNANEIMNADEILAYYTRADISSAGIMITNNDNTYETKLGIKTLLELKKYEVDLLGNYHEVKLPEKRREFNNEKSV